MPAGPLYMVLQHIRKCIGTPASRDQSDGQLLERFLAQRDETAFAALVERHGAMVLSVCRRVLRDPHEAEDAFQATFLVLVRRARSIVRRDSVGSWLYGVAYRIALRARTLAERRQKQQSEVENVPAPESCPAKEWDELRPVLDEEISRLPEKYRQPVVLCYFEGKPYEEAARLLGWPAGTVSGRLARARDILRKRLLRRGVTLASAFPAALLADQRVSAELLAATTKAACQCIDGPAVAAAAISPSVAALTEGMVHALFVQKLKLGAAILAGLLLSAGVAAFSLRGNAGKGPEAVDTQTEVSVKDGTLPRGERQGEVVAVRFAQDGKSVLVARAGTVVFYDPVTFQPGGRFGPVGPNASGSVVAYDALTHEERGEILTDNRFGFRRLALAPDAKMAVLDLTYSVNDGVVMFDVAAKKELGALKGTPPNLSGLAFAPDGKLVAIAGWWPDPKNPGRAQRTAVQLWEVATRQLRTTLEDTGCYAFAFSPGGRILATCGATPDQKAGFVKLWDLGSGDATTLTNQEIEPRQLAFSANGKKLLVGSSQGIQQWDVAERRRDWMRPSTNDKGKAVDVASLACSPDGKLVAAGDYLGQVRILDAASGDERESCKITEAYVTALAFAPDSRSLVIGSGHYFNERGVKLKFDGYPARLWTLKK